MSVQSQRIESRLRREQRSRDRRAAIPLALLAFPLFLSVDLDKFSGTLDSALNAWKVLSAMVLVAMFIHRLMSRKPVSVNVIPMIVIVVFLALSTWAGEGDWQTFVIVWGGFFAVALLVEMTVRDQARILLLALRWVLGAIVLLNFATVVLFPEGLWQAGFEPNWLLGHRNNFGSPLVSAIGVSAALDMITRRRLSLVTVGIAAAALASVVITWSASSVVAVFAAALVVLLASLTRHGLIVLRTWAMIAAYAATAIGVVGFRIQEHMGDFIEGVLNRSTDLTGRTRIWDLTLDLIRESPIWGSRHSEGREQRAHVLRPELRARAQRRARHAAQRRPPGLHRLCGPADRVRASHACVIPLPRGADPVPVHGDPARPLHHRTDLQCVDCAAVVPASQRQVRRSERQRRCGSVGRRASAKVEAPGDEFEEAP